MKTLFKDCLNRLKTQVKKIRWIDQDHGQLDIYDNPPVLFPCALINIQVPNWTSSKQQGIQVGRVELTVRLGFDVRYPANSKVTDPQINKALEHMDIVKDASMAIIGLTGTTYRHLERISTHAKVNEVGIRIYTIVFTGQIKEGS